MRGLLYILFTLFCSSTISAQAPPARGLTAALSRDISVTKIDGGPVVTYGAAVDRGSSIHRRWFVINDSSCPIALGDAGLTTPHYNSPSYQFDAQGTAAAVENVLAFEVLFPVFDLWGDHIRTLSLNQVQDLAPAGHPQPLGGSWFATENDVREYLTSVAYVDKVMTANGKIWRADRKLIAQKLAEVQIAVSESGLERDEAKEPKRP